MKRRLIILICVTLCLAMERVADALELVANGNFQSWITVWDGTVLPTPSWDGWTVTPATEGSNYGLSGVPNSPCLFQAFFGGPGPDCDSIGQTIETEANKSYTFSFWLEQPDAVNDPSHPGDFEALWNGVPVLSITSAIDFGWTNYSYTALATGASSTIGFYGRADRNTTDLRGFFLTGVSVLPAPIPEPGTIALLGSGLLFLAAWRRLRQS